MRSTEGFTQLKDLPEIQWRNQSETGGGHYKKQNALPEIEKMRQTVRGSL